MTSLRRSRDCIGERKKTIVDNGASSRTEAETGSEMRNGEWEEPEFKNAAPTEERDNDRQTAAVILTLQR
jgi:hypothetical protein